MMKNKWQIVYKIALFSVLISVFLCSAVLQAEDWPTFRHDYSRSGSSSEKLNAPALEKSWVYKSPYPPAPAWYGPAKWDAYAKLPHIPAMRDYDTVFHPVVAGNKVYFGSSSDDSIHCLNLADGKTLWSFTADSPIHIAPSVTDGRLYFGADDGYAYCLDAQKGSLIWKFSPEPGSRLIAANNRFISIWPCRSGVVVDKGVAYFANSLFPWKYSSLTAVDAVTGKVVFQRKFEQSRPVQEGKISMEGPLSLSDDYIIAPRGRVVPMLFSRKNGEYVGVLNTGAGQVGRGGAYVVLCGDDQACYGPGNNNWSIDAFSMSQKKKTDSYPDGKALVVAGNVRYVLTEDSVCAYQKGAEKAKWKQGVEYAHELILADDVLFVGGDDRIRAFRASDGKILWENDAVQGRVHGLVVANGNLLASTDEGNIYCFRPASGYSGDVSGKIAPPAVSDNGLLDCWVFEDKYFKDNKFLNVERNFPAKLSGMAGFCKAGKYSTLLLDGKSTSLRIADDISKLGLPVRDLTVSGWVRIDAPIPWGGIIGAFQDNGNYERGWVLGYSNSKFYFRVAGKNGNGRLTTLSALENYRLGEWYYVAGTYDGNVMRLYINGEMVSDSTLQKGDISYPTHAFYEIGGYHDDDEYFPMHGMIHEVCVYNRVLPERELAKHVAKKILQEPVQKRTEGWQLATGPYLRFITPDKAAVFWETKVKSPTLLEYSDGGKTFRYEDKKATTRHLAYLTDLRRNHIYNYKITAFLSGKKHVTRDFEVDTLFDFVPDTIDAKPDLAYQQEAKNILLTTKEKRGICIVLGSGKECGLAYELARQSQFYVIGVDNDTNKISAGRDKFIKGSIYGDRLTLRYVQDLSALPFTGDIATLVVAGEGISSEKEINRILRPNGGIAVTVQPGGKRGVIKKGPLPGVGVWTHMYGRADNSTCGGETLQGVTKTSEMQIQWVGRPGPRFHADRNGRPSSPLAVNGRLFFQGMDRIAAIDAYNGAMLWTLEIPGIMRFNIPRDCGNWCADEDYIFIAVHNQCWKIRALDGIVDKRFPVISGNKKEWEYNWGYIARQDGILFGSAVKKGSSNKKFWGPQYKYGWGDSIAHSKVCSDNLFALNANTGKQLWSYSIGVIINPTITVGGNRIYFLESRDSEINSGVERRIASSGLWNDLFLVALDIKTGNKLWEQQLKIKPGDTAVYMAYSDDILVLESSAHGTYYLYAYNAVSGDSVWDNAVDWPVHHHGGDMNRPAIVDGKLYVRPKTIDLKNGTVFEIGKFWGVCGTYAAYENGLIMRSGGVITLWHLNMQEKKWKRSGWARLRPNCWLSAIPGCGMLLAPEDGGGCSCGIWLETSAGFIPKKKQ